MTILQQSENAYASFLGRYGVCNQTDCDSLFDLSSSSLIFSVIAINTDGGTDAYVKGNPWFLQKIKKLTCGNVYWITLEPGTESLQLDDFILSVDQDSSSTNLPLLSSCDNNLIQSSELSQKQFQYNSYLGWYGICKENSEPAVEISKFDTIFSVYQTMPGGGTSSYIKGNPDYLQTLTQFKPGNAYWITLEPGHDTFVINGFVAESLSNSILLDINCSANFGAPETPTPTPKKKIKFPVMLIGWEWPDRVDKMGRVRLPGGSNKFSDEPYLFDDYDYRNLEINDILKMLNEEGYKYPDSFSDNDSPTGSVSDYFKAISFGQFEIEFEILPAGDLVNVDSNNPDDFAMIFNQSDVSCSYDTKFGKNAEYPYQLDLLVDTGYQNIRRNLTSLGRTYEDEFYDKPLTILHAGVSKDNSYVLNYFIRSHKTSVNVSNRAENLTITITNLKRPTPNNSAYMLEPVGVPIHETIHTWGLIDLYEASRNPVGTGFNKLGIMSYGVSGSGTSKTEHLPTWPIAWSRYELSKNKLFDVNLVEITESTKNIEIFPAYETNTIYRINHPTKEDVWWIDYRTPNSKSYNGINYDEYLNESGLCIVHQGGNQDGPKNNAWAFPLNRRGESGYYVSLEQADGGFELQSRGNINISNDLFKPGDEISPYTVPSTVSRSGKPSGIKIYNIRETEKNTMMFDVEFLKSPAQKIVSVNYNFPEKFYTNLGDVLVWNPQKFKSKIIAVVTTENIPNGTRINLKINPTAKSAVTTAYGVVNNNSCAIQVENQYAVNKTKKRIVNYFKYDVNSTDSELLNIFPYTDYVIVQ